MAKVSRGAPVRLGKGEPIGFATEKGGTSGELSHHRGDVHGGQLIQLRLHHGVEALREKTLAKDRVLLLVRCHALIEGVFRNVLDPFLMFAREEACGGGG